MTYDKDILWCRRVMGIIGLLQFPAAGAVYVVEHNWISAFVCAVWAWACFRVRDSMAVQQKTRDSQRVITATLDGRLAEEIEKGTWRPGDSPLIPDEAFDALGFKAYKCPKCGKVSHHPMDLLHRYCAACHEFERG